MKCDVCGKDTWCSYSYKGQDLCEECMDYLKETELRENSKSITRSCDFKGWKNEDLSELFWITIGDYQKDPSEEKLKMLSMLFYWACHIDHGLANCFSHALDWCKISLH